MFKLNDASTHETQLKNGSLTNKCKPKLNADVADELTRDSGTFRPTDKIPMS